MWQTRQKRLSHFSKHIANIGHFFAVGISGEIVWRPRNDNVYVTACRKIKYHPQKNEKKIQQIKNSVTF